MNENNSKIAHSTGKIALWGTLCCLLIAGMYAYWCYQDNHPSTDDAYVKANIVAIAAQVTGPIDKLYVHEHQFVSKGTLLFSVEDQPYILAVNKAKAALTLAEQQVAMSNTAITTAKEKVNEAKAQLTVAEKNAQRILPLVKEKIIAANQGDKTKSELKVAEAAYASSKSELQRAIQNHGQHGSDNAQIRQAKASLEQAQLDLKHTRVYAPNSGTIENFNLRPHSMVVTNQALFSLIEQGQWWVNANFKETQLTRIRKGKSATIELDMYPDTVFKGTVQDIGRSSNSEFSLLPAENASGNFVKVTQRFPVRIRISKLDPEHPLRVGASATVTINAE